MSQVSVKGQRTSMMHDVPRDFLHQLLEGNLGELTRKDILNQVRVAFSDFVTYAQYWRRCPRVTTWEHLWDAVECGGHGENDAHTW